jgi:hypothetical protein
MIKGVKGKVEPVGKYGKGLKGLSITNIDVIIQKI